ncbi:unnamed protein product [Musa acuminata subsp. malaccensis]|uniref:(wild Malaysian banana) hypothetical protein n=1 Tax=Musa acuminata subsp. malaccensis TaxID=214687 RepID=A0A804HQ29_MUSAM|nr:unnamed protein product [Musa acuminata subsp. malaccensis]
MAAMLVLLLRAMFGCYGKRRQRSLAATFLGKIPRVVYNVPSSPSPSSPTVSVVDPQPDRESCTICIEEFVSGEELCMLPQCNHLFHGVCIQGWLLSPSLTCPVCRKFVIPKSEGNERELESV